MKICVKLQKYRFGQNYPQFYSKLIITENIPDHALHKDFMFIKCNKLSQRERSQLLKQQTICGFVSLENMMINEIFYSCSIHSGFCQFCSCFGFSFSKCQGFRLSEKISQQFFLMI